MNPTHSISNEVIDLTRNSSSSSCSSSDDMKAATAKVPVVIGLDVNNHCCGVSVICAATFKAVDGDCVKVAKIEEKKEYMEVIKSCLMRLYQRYEVEQFVIEDCLYGGRHNTKVLVSLGITNGMIQALIWESFGYHTPVSLMNVLSARKKVGIQLKAKVKIKTRVIEWAVGEMEDAMLEKFENMEREDQENVGDAMVVAVAFCYK